MNSFQTSDLALLDTLRRVDAMTVLELADALAVTATAVRQRLTRLVGQGYVHRRVKKAGRGRPSHHYSLTDKGRRKAGANFGDLAIALWKEVKEIKDPEVRRGLLGRIAARLAQVYRSQIHGDTLEQKMRSLVALLDEREVPFEVETTGELPVLNALACPYPGLAEQDRTICSLEKQLFSEVLGEDLKLSKCRLDGESCCTFQLN